MVRFLGWLPQQSKQPELRNGIVPSGHFLPNIVGGNDTGNRERALWSDDEMNITDTFDLQKWKAECAADTASILARQPHLQGFRRFRGRSQAKQPRALVKLPNIHGRASPVSRPESVANTEGASAPSKPPSRTQRLFEDCSDVDPIDAYDGLICRGDVGASIRLRKEQEHDSACARELKKQTVGRQCRKRAKAWRKKMARQDLQKIDEVPDVQEEKETEVEEEEKVDGRIAKILSKKNRRKTKQAGESEILAQGLENGEPDAGSPSSNAQPDPDDLLDGINIQYGISKMRPERSAKDRLKLLKKLHKERIEKEEEERMKKDRYHKYEALPEKERHHLWNAFKHFDRDDSGTLDVSELKQCLTELGIRGNTGEEKQAITQLCTEISMLSSICPEVLKQMSKEERASHVRRSGGTKEPVEVGFYAFCVELVPAARFCLRKIRQGWVSEYFYRVDEKHSGVISIKAMNQALDNMAEVGEVDLRVKNQVLNEVLYDPKERRQRKEVDLDLFQQVVSAMSEHAQRRQRIRERKIQEQTGLEDSTFDKVRSELATLWETFCRYDSDRSGYLDGNEYIEMVKSLGLLPRDRVAREEIDHMIKDTWEFRPRDSPGIDIQSFVTLMLTIREKNGERKAEDQMRIFNWFDKDKSGELNIAEIGDVLEAMDMAPKTKEEQEDIAAIIQDLDDNGNGEMDFEEFQIFTQRFTEKQRTRQMKEELQLCAQLGFSERQHKEFRQCFDQFDKDASNSLDVQEVRAVLSLLHLNVSAEHLRQAFDALDRDDSGVLEFPEFLHLMKMLHEKTGIFAGLRKMRLEEPELGVVP